MIRKKTYYIGFYRDYSTKKKPYPLVCQVTDNVDCLSCELLGGDFPLLEIFSTPAERDVIAKNTAKQFNATHLEILKYSRKKMMLTTGVPDAKIRPKGMGKGLWITCI